MVTEIFVIVQTIGDLETVQTAAYTSYNKAKDIANSLTQKAHEKGYIDITYRIRTLECIND